MPLVVAQAVPILPVGRRRILVLVPPRFLPPLPRLDVFHAQVDPLVILVVVLPAVSLLPSPLIVELVSLPRHLCHQCAGIFAVFTVAAVALWPLSRWRRRCRRCADILAVIELASSPSLLVIKLASLPLMPRSLCRRYDCNCRPHHDGVITVVDAQVSLLLLSWCVVALVTVTSSPLILIRDGVVAILKLTWFSG